MKLERRFQKRDDASYTRQQHQANNSISFVDDWLCFDKWSNKKSLLKRRRQLQQYTILSLGANFQPNPLEHASPVEIHSPPHRLSTTPEDLNYATYAITYVAELFVALRGKWQHRVKLVDTGWTRKQNRPIVIDLFFRLPTSFAGSRVIGRSNDTTGSTKPARSWMR
ncbi:hypothetical protein T4D_12063 [Trichinella pseudospiralis]|uniref:Uncharacterized protein n=1 Tax=Trichinella pseudospiralis TaxID=6337 RepID=A0A0V1FPG1_TRIPS|nr:hypothetical protein T4D_12063 [Trichinella pseudospiralis]